MEKANSIEDIQKRIPICRKTLYEEINSGRLKTFKIRRRRFATDKAIDDYIAMCEAEAVT